MSRSYGARRIALTTVLLMLSIALVSMFLAVPAHAQSAPEADLTEELQRTTSTATGGAGTQATTATSGSSASSDATAARVVLFDTEILVVGETQARAGNKASSDASVISVLGHEVIGAHSEADGGSGNSVTGLAHELCDVTEGSLCLALLYGEANSSDSGGTSESSAYAALAAACVGGGQTDPDEDCEDGSVDAAVGESRSSARNDATAGTATSEQSSTVARLCLGNDSSTDACDGIGFVLLHGESKSSGTNPEPVGFSFQGGGEDHGGFPHPGVMGDCPDENTGNCIVFNDGSANGGAAFAGDPVVATGGTSTAHAEGVVLQLVLMGNEIVRASNTEADTRSGQSSADATVLAILGHEVIGAHATASGGSGESETGYLTETCEATDGSICLALLYGHAVAEDSTTSSSGSSDTFGGTACLGGNQSLPEDNCDGAVGVMLLESHSDASQNKTTGAADAMQSTTGADVCLGGENDEGVCEGLGIVILHSEAESHAAPGTTPTSSGDSAIVIVEAGGEEQGALDQEGTIAIPPDCPPGSSLLCLVLNQVDTSATATGADAGATVGDVVVLPGADGSSVADGTASDSNASASAGTRVLGETRRRPAAEPAPKLPATGASIAVLILLAAAALAGGYGLRRGAVVGS